MNVCPKIKKVKEETKNKASNIREEDTEEMIGRRSMSQEEMDQCWKRLADKRSRTNARWKTAKEELTDVEAPFWKGGVYEEAGSTEYESGVKIVGQEFSLCPETTTCSVCKACMRTRRRKKR